MEWRVIHLKIQQQQNERTIAQSVPPANNTSPPVHSLLFPLMSALAAQRQLIVFLLLLSFKGCVWSCAGHRLTGESAGYEAVVEVEAQAT